MKKSLVLSTILAVLFVGLYSFTGNKNLVLKRAAAVKAVNKNVKKKYGQCDNVTITPTLTINGNTSVTLSWTTTGYYTSTNYGGYWNSGDHQFYSFPSGAAYGNSVTVYVPNTNIYGGRIGVSCGCADGSTTTSSGALFTLPRAGQSPYNQAPYYCSYPDTRYF